MAKSKKPIAAINLRKQGATKKQVSIANRSYRNIRGIPKNPGPKNNKKKK